MNDSKELARRIRRHALAMAHRAKTAHIGSCLSVADILAVLYSDVLSVRPEQPEWEERDRLILSKGHAAMALYATLAERGFFPVAELEEYGHPESRLCGHVHADVPGVEVSTGSLGHGLSIGCGMALAAKADKSHSRVFVVLSDGECQEGSIWEAAMFACHRELGNLTAVIDRNRIQACGRTEDVMRLEPLAMKWAAFGWEVEDVGGHDHAALRDALRPQAPNRPRAIIARTVKGRGVSFMEDTIEWHYRHPDDAELKTALRELQVNV